MSTFIKICVYLVIAGISFVFFRILSNIFSSFGTIEEKFESAVNNRLKTKKEFSKKKRYLSKNGVMYRLKDYDLSPSKYMILRLFIALVLGLLGYAVSGLVLASVGGGVLGYFGCDFVFKRLNKSDNAAMLSDLFNLYLTLKIQLASGIYIISALLSAKNLITSKRLEEALDELIGNLSNKGIPHTESIELFRDRFNSEEINDLCSFLSSYVTYGVSEKYLKDIMSEVNEIATESMIQEEHALSTKISLITFLYFANILAIVLFCTISSFGSFSVF